MLIPPFLHQRHNAALGLVYTVGPNLTLGAI